MAKKDLYLELVKSSEFLLGEVPDRENIIWALRQTIAEEDLLAALDRLYAQALVSKNETSDGMAYGRCPLSLTAE